MSGAVPAWPRPARMTACVALACACLLPLRTTADAPGIEVVAEQVSAHVHVVVGHAGAASAANQGFMSNAGFVVTPEGVVVFDALGTPALATAMLKRIRERSDAPIRKVIVSHYHPDHFYGLAPLKAAGAEIWADRKAGDYLASPAAASRLAERRQTLKPWIDADTRLLAPDRVLDGDTAFSLGGVDFRILRVGPAHTPEDIVMLVEPDGALFVGDLLFGGRLPFVGESDSRAWLVAIDRILDLAPRLLIPGHGRPIERAGEQLRLTRDYLSLLRRSMGEAVDNFVPFDEAFAATDWSAFAHLPLFAETNRINAYNTYLLMERESLQTAR